MKRIKMFVAKIIWFIIEKYDLDLGELTPKIFGMMIGCENYSVIEIESLSENND